MIEFETATTVYKALHGLAPEYMWQMFTKLSENISRSLRNTRTYLRIHRFATSYGQRSFSYRGVTVWNKLSTEGRLGGVHVPLFPVKFPLVPLFP